MSKGSKHFVFALGAINDWRAIVCGELVFCEPSVGFMDSFIRKLPELRNPSANELAILIKSLTLPDGIKNSEVRCRISPCASRPDAVLIHGGRFIMGDCGDDSYGYDSPCKEVIVEDLYVSKYEVTIREYRQCVDYGYCRELPFRISSDDGHIELSAHDQLPAFGLTWVDAQKYASWLAAATDTGWRLPSEAEWEYFARAGSSSVYYWGDGENCDKVASKAFSHLCDDILVGPMSVGSREPNAWGLYDVLGSVSEYTLDCWYYPYDPHHNTGEPIVSGDCSKRVKRGGGWLNSTSLRARSRWPMPVDKSQIDDGLRLVLDANEVSNTASMPTR